MTAKKHLTYRIELTPDPEGKGITVTVPVLRGCISWGRDYQHAIEMAQEAIELYLDSCAKEGFPIPSSDADLPIPAAAFVEVHAPAGKWDHAYQPSK